MPNGNHYVHKISLQNGTDLKPKLCYTGKSSVECKQQNKQVGLILWEHNK